MTLWGSHGPPRLPAPRALRSRYGPRRHPHGAAPQDRPHEHPRSDYAPERLARAAGPFGEEITVFSWADRLAARGPRLKEEHIERHRKLCTRLLSVSRNLGPYPEPNYNSLASKMHVAPGANVGYAASRVRLLAARGLFESEAVRHVAGLPCSAWFAKLHAAGALRFQKFSVKDIIGLIKWKL